MSNEPPLPDILMYFFILLLVAGVVGTLVFFIVRFRPEINPNTMDRFSVSMAESLANSELVISRFVFDEAQMKKYKDEDEPFANCLYGYRFKLESMEEKKTFEFGFRPNRLEKLDSDSKDLPVGLLSKGKILQSKLTLSVYDTWFTRLTCAIKTAYQTKKPQELGMPCSTSIGKCGVSLRRKGNNPASASVCLFEKGKGLDPDLEFDCRYLPDIPVHTFYAKNSEKKIVNALPIRSGVGLPPETTDCGDMRDFVASGADSVGEIALCVEAKS